METKTLAKSPPFSISDVEIANLSWLKISFYFFNISNVYVDLVGWHLRKWSKGVIIIVQFHIQFQIPLPSYLESDFPVSLLR